MERASIHSGQALGLQLEHTINGLEISLVINTVSRASHTILILSPTLLPSLALRMLPLFFYRPILDRVAGGGGITSG